MKHGTRLWAFLVAIVSLWLFVACGGSEEATPSPSASPTSGQQALRPLQIGHIVDQTGPLAPLGASYLRGVELATEIWNADATRRKVTVRVCDSQSTGEGALACYRQLEGWADAIVGPNLFVGLASVRGVASGKPPVVISTVPFVEPPANSYIFQTIPNVEDAVAVVFQYFQRKGIRRVATLTSNDQPGNLAKDAASKLAGNYNIQLVRSEVFDPQAQNVAPQAQNIAAAQPEAVFVWTAGAQLITVLRAIHGANITVPVMLNYASMNLPLLRQAGNDVPPELLFFATDVFDPSSVAANRQAYKDRIETFNRQYQAKYGAVPDLLAYATADILFIVAQAGANVDSPAALKQALESGAEFQGVLFEGYSFSREQHVARVKPGFSFLRWNPSSATWSLAR